MSPLAWTGCIAGFVLLLVLVQKWRAGGNGRRKRESAAQRENAELRHVVTEMSMEKHRSRGRD